MSDDCSQNLDPLKLVREGTNQAQRYLPELAPSYAQVNEHGPEHCMVFAQAYAAFLKFYDSNNTFSGNWQGFFSEDVSVRLATVAIDDIETYKVNVKAHFDFLNNLENQSKPTELSQSLGYLFSMLATLARQLDYLKNNLPADVALKGILRNLITGKLAPAFEQLIAIYKAGHALSLILESPPDDVHILGGAIVTFESIKAAGLSTDWMKAESLNWHDYVHDIHSNHTVYGTPSSPTIPDVFERINHLATHNLFTGIFDEFLKVYARVIKEAQLALEESYKNKSNHQPHYALFIAFLRLFEYARGEANTITQRHLDLYYREILQLKEKPAVPANAHLLVELSKHAGAHEIEANSLFKAGKDNIGHDVFFANSRQLVANQAKVAALKTVYRHGDEKIADSEINKGRLFASPVANSEDGNGAALNDTNQSWHPFFNKHYQDGVLADINMPEAELGFAIASHYLLLAEGVRTITLNFTCASGTGTVLTSALLKDFRCLLTIKDGWFEAKSSQVTSDTSGILKINLSGADPAIIPFDAKVHGASFATDLPVMQIYLQHHDGSSYAYDVLQEVKLQNIDLTVSVTGLKTLAISNDFGPIDASQPFMPFGALPNGDESLVIGSKEIFQKTLSTLTVTPQWQGTPSAYPSTSSPKIAAEYLVEGKWNAPTMTHFGFSGTSVDLAVLKPSAVDVADFTEPDAYSTKSKHGFIKLKLDAGFGHAAYQLALIVYTQAVAHAANQAAIDALTKPSAIVVPVLSSLTMGYSATQSIVLTDKNNFNDRKAHFYHLTPFGYAEQHPYLKFSSQISAIEQEIYLLTQFKHRQLEGAKLVVKNEAEFYIGLVNLQPPQSISMLFQVSNGTADPLLVKPKPHIHWSYLSNNEWHAFALNDVEDSTAGLLNSGVITFSVPRDASNNNSILPAGAHWIRACVEEKSAATCQLLLVAAQALVTTYQDKMNDINYQSNGLPAGTITQLNASNSDVKSISQPFESFGGRALESTDQFYTRVSERLRHKDRAIALWDFERLILEAFPQIYQVKCLNHTHYEATVNGVGTYRELAAGHVTIVTIPNIKIHNINNPLRPNTSLGLLEEIKLFLVERQSGFVQLHVANPEFEEVQLKFNLRLYDGFDETFYVKKLQETLTQFLSPWVTTAEDGNSLAPSFGGRLYKSVLINYIEDLPYVDYVTDVQLIHYYLNEVGQLDSEESNEVAGSKALSILVSKPASQHEITVIHAGVDTTAATACGCES
ncbi:MAG: baseplate J/gp47 family protein [Methylotenera sp.]